MTGPEPILPAHMPVLVLGGELDTWTPPAGVPAVLAEIGGHSRFVELANSTHVVGEGDTACGSSLVQRFVAQPGTIDSLDAACAPLVAPIHAVGVYAATLAEQPPIQAGAGGAGEGELKLAAAAVATAGDALARYRAIEAARDHGLRGGTVTASGEGGVLTLDSDELVGGVRVSGTVTLSPATTASGGESVTADLTVKAPPLPKASFTASWSTTGSTALVSGSVGGHTVQGTTPAP